MKKKYIYKCQFSSLNLLTGTLGDYCISVVAYNLSEVKTSLRGLGYHLGKDFVYWKLPDVSPKCPNDLKFVYAYKK